ncbi:Qat anti-phage system TatD family nuclease QatD [Priestia aryabhattai]|uniref:Qat anti-phage system TatD family nuclease QatD n=1 Tax=Priestia aryabhattai TaxID=412384 RepID=UPI00203E758C|nr:Qat anti-phage system TatD family nuclease QatD [Priestia aryabhattai]MCM3252548.1 TatD family hydrolase [Priestia aryabhattai]
MNPFYHDTHVHLDLYKNSSDIIHEINEKKSYTISVTNLPILYDKAVSKHLDSKYVRFALGIHPELVGKFPEQIPFFYKKILDCRYIGEIGLDFTGENISYKDLQLEVFKKTIEICNLCGGKILSIHSRGATKEVIEIIGSEFNGKIILHWFSGNMTDIERAVQNGYYFSVNLDMFNTAKGRKIINKLPIERILLESDGPFTKSFRKAYNIFSIDKAIRELGNIKSIEIEKVNMLLKRNFQTLLN